MTTPFTVFTPREDISRVLVVVAHPDDIDFGMGGTVATLVAQGAHVEYLLVTSGDAGGDESTHTKEERGAVREVEQRAAAAVHGISELTFLRYDDGTVVESLGLRRDIARVIRRVRPDLVMTQNPEWNFNSIYGSHPDHMVTAAATMRAVYPDARNPHAFPELLAEGFAPHKVPWMWMANNQPNFVVDITDVFDAKVQALQCHESQVGHRDDLREALENWGRTNATTAGLPEGRLGEIFREINTN